MYSSANLASALNIYDSQTSYLTYYITSPIAGEDEDIAALRKFYKNLPNTKTMRGLTLDELFTLIKILAAAKPTNHKLHNDIIDGLIAPIGKEKFAALAKLDQKNQLTKQHYEMVINHQNPLSAAKAIAHYYSYTSAIRIIKYGTTITEDQTLTSFLSEQDPYQAIKKITSEKVALKILDTIKLKKEESINENMEEYRKIIQTNPIEAAYALKKFSTANRLPKPEAIQKIISRPNPKNLIDAHVLLFKNQHEINDPDLFSKMLKETQAVQHPLEFMTGVLLLQKWQLNTDENRAQLSQSPNPVMRAKAIETEFFISKLKTSNFSFAVGMVATTFRGKLQNPIAVLEEKKTQQLNASNIALTK